MFVFVISIAAYLLVLGALDMVLLRNLGPTRGHTTVVTSLHPLLVLEATINRANYATPGPEQVAKYPALVGFYLTKPLATFSILSVVSSFLMLLFCSLFVRRIGAGDSPAMIWLKAKLRLAEQGAARTHAAPGSWARATRSPGARPTPAANSRPASSPATASSSSGSSDWACSSTTTTSTRTGRWARPTPRRAAPSRVARSSGSTLR
ncbi:hypothetical protein OT109_13000 [Phycisphaeraceae bacterium D3-23]